MSTTQHNTTLMRVPVSQVERLQRTGSPFSGKSYVNEFGIGAGGCMQWTVKGQ